MASILSNNEHTAQRFTELVDRFCRIKTVSKDAENIDINVVLDHLSSFRLTDSQSLIQSKDVCLLIEHCCYLITPNSGQLGIKCCGLITYVLIKSEIDIPDNLLLKLVKFLQNLTINYDSWATADILRTLSVVLHGRGGTLSVQQLDELVTTESGFLYRIILAPTSDAATRKLALECVASLCYSCVPYIDDYYASQSLSIFLSVLKTRFSKTDELMQCQLLTTALNGIHLVLSNTSTAHGSLLGELLAALKAYNFYGRDDPNVQIPTCLQPVSMGEAVASLGAPSPPSHPQKKRLRKKGKPRKPKRDTYDYGGGDVENEGMEPLPWQGHSGSESDFSDTESSGALNKLQGHQARVRQHSLAALYTVVKNTVKRLVFGYWTSFLPTGAEDKAGTLVAVLHDEPSTRVRISALATIAAFIYKSKSFLLTATEIENTSTPFTPFSVLLGNMIKELHVTLLNHLRVESSPQTITQTLKCLATVVGNSPYQKLKPGLLTKTVTMARPYLSNRDVNVRVAALTFMGAVVTIHAPLLEVSHILLPPLRQEDSGEQDSTRVKVENGNNSSSPNSLPGSPAVTTPCKPTNSSAASKDSVVWLIRSCGRCIHNSGPSATIPLPMRLEALQVLSSLVLGYLPVIRSSLPHITNILTPAFVDNDPSVQYHAAKASESLALAFSRQLVNQEESTDDKTFTVDDAVTFWNSLLSGPLVEALQNDSHTQLRSVCCECLASIGSKVFEAIEPSKQIICLTMLLGMAADSEPLVREAASRALGVYVLFPCQRTDVSFVADAANAIIILCMEDKHLNVKIKAAWAMANVTDALVLNLSGDDFDSFASSFSDVLLLKLYDSATDACYGDEKIRYNGVRALGSLLRYTQPRTLQRRNMTEIIENSVKLLVQNLSQSVMKVRWNACYALGSLLQNDYITLPSATWLEQVYTGLCLAMKNSKNFKVRINASQALQTVCQRSKYGPAELFTIIWKYVIEAMNESNHPEDFNNYKYISALSHQLRRTILHLASLTENSDLICLGAMLFSKEDTIKKFLEASTEQLDRTVSLHHLEGLKGMDLDAGGRSVLTSLFSILTPIDLDTDEEEDAGHEKTTFRPSYD